MAKGYSYDKNAKSRGPGKLITDVVQEPLIDKSYEEHCTKIKGQLAVAADNVKIDGFAITHPANYREGISDRECYYDMGISGSGIVIKNCSFYGGNNEGDNNFFATGEINKWNMVNGIGLANASSNITIDNCSLYGIYHDAITSWANSVTIENSSITGCKSGINIINGDLDLINTTMDVTAVNELKDTYGVKFAGNNMTITGGTIVVYKDDKVAVEGIYHSAIVIREGARGNLAVTEATIYGEVIDLSEDENFIDSIIDEFSANKLQNGWRVTEDGHKILIDPITVAVNSQGAHYEMGAEIEFTIKGLHRDKETKVYIVIHTGPGGYPWAVEEEVIDGMMPDEAEANKYYWKGTTNSHGELIVTGMVQGELPYGTVHIRLPEYDIGQDNAIQLHNGRGMDVTVGGEVADRYVLAQDEDFSGEVNGEFRYTGSAEYVEIPHVIKGVPVTSYKNMFKGTTVKGVKSDNIKITDMSRMFYESKATSFYLSNLDTSSVTTMSEMFYRYQANSLDLSSFNTSNVTDMRAMLVGYYEIEDKGVYEKPVSTRVMSNESPEIELNLSGFDTSKVTNMMKMFYRNQAYSLDLSSFDTSNVIDMTLMFGGSQAVSLDLSSFNTSKVTDMRLMFRDSQASTLDLSSFDTSNVTHMGSMFDNSQATTINLSSFDTSKVSDMAYMFQDSQASSLDLSNFDTSNVTVMNGMFNGSQATSINLSSFNTSKVRYMGYMFQDSQASSLDLSGFDTSSVDFVSSLFAGSQATSLDLSSFNTSKVEYMDAMFADSQATTIDLSSFDTSNVENMENMFAGSQATSLDLSSFDTSNVTEFGNMFKNCLATKGYARTQEDADRFNASSDKPAGLTFVAPIVFVNSITVTGAVNSTTIDIDGGALQMSAEVTPGNASNKNVTWSVENEDETETDLASISESGLLTALRNGTVKVKATAKDGSGIVGIKDITISKQVAQDNADIAAAKDAIEGAIYTASQVEAENASAAKAKAQTLVDALGGDLKGATAVVLPGTFTPATAGVVGSPDGADGSYTFTVTVDKGAGSQATSAEQTMTISATGLYALAQDSDFSGTTNGEFRYIGHDEYVEIPNVIKGIPVTSYKSLFINTSVKGVKSNNKNVTDMSTMFYGGKSASLSLSSFDTSSVTDMSKMFNWNKAISLDLSGFDTSSVTNMSEMFCRSDASSLDLSGFNTSSVTDMSNMFKSSEATSLDLSSFDTSNVTDMNKMFDWNKATSINLSSFNTSNVTNMSYMFSGNKVPFLDLSGFDTSKVTNMFCMFSGNKATSLDLSGFDTSNVTDMYGMFNGSQAGSLDLSSFDTSSVTCMHSMFDSSQASSINLSSFNTSNVTVMTYMFYKSQASSLDLSGFNTSSVTNMSYMFEQCKATKGYARTQEDADRFNASSNKPAGLTFIVQAPTFGLQVGFGSIHIEMKDILDENGAPYDGGFSDFYALLDKDRSGLKFYKEGSGVAEITLSFNQLESASDIVFNTSMGAITVNGDIELNTQAFATGGSFQDFEVFEHDRASIRAVATDGSWDVSKFVAVPYLSFSMEQSINDLYITVSANEAYGEGGLPAFLAPFDITELQPPIGATVDILGATDTAGNDYAVAKGEAVDIGKFGDGFIKAWYVLVEDHSEGEENISDLETNLDPATDTFNISAARDEGTVVNAVITLYIIDNSIGTIQYEQLRLFGSGAGTTDIIVSAISASGNATKVLSKGTPLHYTVISDDTQLGKDFNSISGLSTQITTSTKVGQLLDNLEKESFHQAWIVTSSENVPESASVFGTASAKDPANDSLQDGDVLTVLSSDWTSIRSYAITVTEEEVDKGALNTEIESANTNKTSVGVSFDGSDIPTIMKWVTNEVMVDYETAIGIAQGVADDPTANQEAVNQALTDLGTATGVFNASKENGTMQID